MSSRSRTRPAESKELRRRLDETFSEWLLVPAENGDSLKLFAVTRHAPDTDDFREAEDLFFGEFLVKLREEATEQFDEDGSQVVSLDDLLLTVWMSAWKLDLDFLTYGAKGAPDSPEPSA